MRHILFGIFLLVICLNTFSQVPDTAMVRFSAMERTKVIKGFAAVDSVEVCIVNPVGDTMFNKNIKFEKEIRLPMGKYSVRAEIKDYPEIYEEVAIFNDRKSVFYMTFIFEKKSRIRPKVLNRHEVKKKKTKRI